MTLSLCFLSLACFICGGLGLAFIVLLLLLSEPRAAESVFGMHSSCTSNPPKWAGDRSSSSSFLVYFCLAALFVAAQLTALSSRGGSRCSGGECWHTNQHVAEGCGTAWTLVLVVTHRLGNQGWMEVPRMSI